MGGWCSDLFWRVVSNFLRKVAYLFVVEGDIQVCGKGKKCLLKIILAKKSLDPRAVLLPERAEHVFLPECSLRLQLLETSATVETLIALFFIKRHVGSCLRRSYCN